MAPHRLFTTLLLCFAIIAATAQTTEWSLLHRGNKAFRQQNFKQAENYYRRALESNPHSSRAAFNLGDAYLAQKNTKDALTQYINAAKAETDPTIRGMAYHNVGYVHHLNKEYDKAIDAYKEALRNNPHDADTRYNLVLAQKQRKQQQDQQKQQQKKQKEQQPQEQQQNQQRQQNQQMSDDNAEQLLQLARQAEQATRRKMEQARRPQPRQLNKNW